MMEPFIVYGIKNCDTVKKALKWLDDHQVKYTFHDYKSKGITADKLKSWIEQSGWESLVNKKGLTWKQLDDSVKARVTDADKAIDLLKEKTSMIKRPLIESGGKVIALGFEEARYQKTFKN